MADTLLMVGTRKGLWIGRSDEARDGLVVHRARTSTWRRSTPAWSTPAATGRGCSPARRSSWLGPQVWRSDDLGETWQETPDGAVRFPEGTDARPSSGSGSWCPASRTASVYAGTEPGAVLQLDRPRRDVPPRAALWDHPHRKEWGAGYGGQAFHTILPAPRRPATR